jgi:hypothetical protein
VGIKVETKVESVIGKMEVVLDFDIVQLRYGRYSSDSSNKMRGYGMLAHDCSQSDNANEVNIVRHTVIGMQDVLLVGPITTPVVVEVSWLQPHLRSRAQSFSTRLYSKYTSSLALGLHFITNSRIHFSRFFHASSVHTSAMYPSTHEKSFHNPKPIA